MMTIGLYDPEALEGLAIEQSGEQETIEEAFPMDLLLAFCNEAVLAGDEFEVRSDRYGRTLSQPAILHVTIV